jgi:hypothetical protein
MVDAPKSLPVNTSGKGNGLPAGPLTVPLTGDPGLERVARAWPALPPHVKAAVLALVEATGG